MTKAFIYWTAGWVLFRVGFKQTAMKLCTHSSVLLDRALNEKAS